MRRVVAMVLGGLTAVLAANAGDGVPPRASISDYPVHRDARDATIAAAVVPPELSKKIFPAEVYKNYVVVEVGIFPQPGATAYVDIFDFGLKFSADLVTYARTPEEIVSIWDEKNAPQPASKVDVTTVTGVVYESGNDPVNGRTRGWGTYSGVAIGPGQPKPPTSQTTDPRVFEANVRARALPEGPTIQPVAGYLYFPLPAKKAKGAPVELRYQKDGVLLTLPVKTR